MSTPLKAAGRALAKSLSVMGALGPKLMSISGRAGLLTLGRQNSELSFDGPGDVNVSRRLIEATLNRVTFAPG
jgi:hypothetical protein